MGAIRADAVAELGVEKFQKLEKLTYQTLIDRKIIKPKGVLIDATVFPENICYPTDVGLITWGRINWTLAVIPTKESV